ncbi:hypothetical protein D3C71_1743370 [compost metagenome]
MRSAGIIQQRQGLRYCRASVDQRLDIAAGTVRAHPERRDAQADAGDGTALLVGDGAAKAEDVLLVLFAVFRKALPPDLFNFLA